MNPEVRERERERERKREGGIGQLNDVEENADIIRKKFRTNAFSKGYFQSFAGNIVNRCFQKYKTEEGKGGEMYFENDFEDVLRHVGIEPPHCIRNFCCANFVAHKSRVQLLSRESW
jgi:hypothetical protein